MVVDYHSSQRNRAGHQVSTKQGSDPSPLTQSSTPTSTCSTSTYESTRASASASSTSSRATLAKAISTCCVLLAVLTGSAQIPRLSLTRNLATPTYTSPPSSPTAAARTSPSSCTTPVSARGAPTGASTVRSRNALARGKSSVGIPLSHRDGQCPYTLFCNVILKAIGLCTTHNT